MGVKNSKPISHHRTKDSNFSPKFRALPSRSLQLQLAHFTPSTFPMIPVLNSYTGSLCEQSWKEILNFSTTNEFGVVTAGVTIFYNEFYERLAKIDTNKKFDTILSNSARNSGQSKIAAKGAILIRIVKYVLAIPNNEANSIRLLNDLGKAHKGRGIRPWQYSVFLEVFIQTISCRLGEKATNDVMESWVNLFAFVLMHMLPNAISGGVDRREMYIGTCDHHANDAVSEVSEVGHLKKKMSMSEVASFKSVDESERVVQLKEK